MSLLGRTSRAGALVAVAVAFTAATAVAQVKAHGAAVAGEGPGIRIREVTGVGPRALVRTPEYSSSISRGRVAARNWAEITVVFDAELDWTDELTFQYYVLCYDKVKDKHTLFKGSATYVEVARGKGHMSAMYLRPATLARYGEVAGVAVEAVVQGNVVATDTIGRQGKGGPLPAEWWKIYKDEIKEGALLNRNQTPFAFVNVDDYETLK